MDKTRYRPEGGPPAGNGYVEAPAESPACAPQANPGAPQQTPAIVVSRRDAAADAQTPVQAPSVEAAGSEPHIVSWLPVEVSHNLLRRLDLPTLATLGRSCAALRHRIGNYLGAELTPAQTLQRQRLQHKEYVRQLDRSRALFGSSWFNEGKAPDPQQTGELLQMVNSQEQLCLPLFDENTRHWQDMLSTAASGTATVLVLEFSADAMLNDCSSLQTALQDLAGRRPGVEIRLRCSFSYLHHRESAALANFLKGAPGIASLWLELGDYFDPALSTLGSVIAESSLRDFRCHTRRHSDQIGSSIFNALAAPQLHSFHLSEIALGSQHAGALAAALQKNPALTDLHLGYSHFFADNYVALAATLVRLTGLQQLEISRNALAGKAMAALAPLLEQSTRLTSLQLNHVWIDDAAGAALGRVLVANTTLTRLELNDNSSSSLNPWTAAGCQPLFRALLENRTLCCFEMSPSRQSAENGLVLGKVLRINPVLEELSLRQLQFSDPSEADEFVAPLLSGLAHNASLRRLALTGLPRVPWPAMTHLFRNNETLVALDFSLNIQGAPAMQALLAAMTGNSRLTELNLSGGRPAGRQSDLPVNVTPLCDLITKHPNLRHLDLSACGIAGGSAELASALAANRTLLSLDLSGNPFDQAGLPALLGAIVAHPTLSVVRLKGLRLSSADLTALANALSQRRDALLLEIDVHHFRHDVASPVFMPAGSPVEDNAMPISRDLLIAALRGNPAVCIPGLLPWMPGRDGVRRWEPAD